MMARPPFKPPLTGGSPEIYVYRIPEKMHAALDDPLQFYINQSRDVAFNEGGFLTFLLAVSDIATNELELLIDINSGYKNRVYVKDFPRECVVLHALAAQIRDELKSFPGGDYQLKRYEILRYGKGFAVVAATLRQP